MKVHRPSPALVVSIVALIVALGGTAVATTKLLITSTSQIKDGAITGKDIRGGTITKRQLSARVLQSSLSGSSVGSPSGGDTAAIEAHRHAGPSVTKGGKATVATLDLPPGVYAVFAKVNLTPNVQDDGLLNTLFKSNKTLNADCTLDVDGTGDFTSGSLASAGTQHNVTLNAQLTRTLDHAGKATLVCVAENLDWHAADATIIAVKVDSSTRTEVSG